MTNETGREEAIAAIMASTQPDRVSAVRRWGCPGALIALTTLVVGAAAAGAAAQESASPNQPVAIDGPAALTPSPCKLVVPQSEAVLQPMKIRPEQVPLKNRLGCLSPADALYGRDGCPIRLCGPTKGAFQLTTP